MNKHKCFGIKRDMSVVADKPLPDFGFADGDSYLQTCDLDIVVLRCPECGKYKIEVFVNGDEYTDD